jgi:hypothetical protein
MSLQYSSEQPQNKAKRKINPLMVITNGNNESFEESLPASLKSEPYLVGSHMWNKETWILPLACCVMFSRSLNLIFFDPSTLKKKIHLLVLSTKL